MKKSLYLNVLCPICLMVITAISCSLLTPGNTSGLTTSDLPNYGVFIVLNNSQYLEISPYYGRPNSNDISSNLVATTTKPTLVIWNPQVINLQYLQLKNLDSNSEVKYKVTPLDEKNEILEIHPVSQLQSGIYCLIQGDPMASPYNIPYWCFTTADEQEEAIIQTPSQESTQESAGAFPGELKFEWQINTGELNVFGVSRDGTIYGLSENIFAIISKEGEVLRSIELDLRDCVHFTNDSLLSDLGMSHRNYLRSDGTILLEHEKFCSIKPGDPPVVDKFDFKWGSFYPFADTNYIGDLPSEPAGYNRVFIKAGYLFIHREFKFGDNILANFQENKMAFVNRNGEVQIIDFPSDLNEKNFKTATIYIAPWDDVYFEYHIFDQIGNDIGVKYMRTNNDGTIDNMNDFDEVIKDPLDYESSAWMPERGELFVVTDSNINVYDMKFNLLRSYTLPQGVSPLYILFGYDMGIYYYYDGDNPTLTKYSTGLSPTQSSSPTLILGDDYEPGEFGGKWIGTYQWKFMDSPSTFTVTFYPNGTGIITDEDSTIDEITWSFQDGQLIFKLDKVSIIFTGTLIATRIEGVMEDEGTNKTGTWSAVRE